MSEGKPAIKHQTTIHQRNAADPKHTVWVTANAGSGKTHVLVERVARLLLSGAEPSTILCITYTKAAAAEMSSRLFARLSKWAIMSDVDLSDELRALHSEQPDGDALRNARRLFARALETPGGLKIQTIHAFCEKLLQQFPVEAGMAPGFSVMTDRDAENQISLAISDTLTEAAAAKSTKLSAALSRVIPHATSTSFESLIKQFLSNAKGLRNILNINLDENQFALILKDNLRIPLYSTSDSVAAEICDVDRELYAQHAGILSNFKIHSRHDTAGLLKLIASSGPTVELFKSLFLTGKLEPRANLIATDTIRRHPDTDEFLEQEKQRIIELINRYDLVQRVEATSNLFVLAKSVHDKTERHKKRLGQYDFDDLINNTMNLLNSSRAAQWVLYKLDAGLKHILVDEAQDTSPAQWKIISALVEEFFSGQGKLQTADRTLFVVGDRKQSIYSFQGADINALAKSRSELSGRISGAGKSLTKVDLDISYRSTSAILDTVDLVFPPNQPLLLGFEPDDQTENPHQTNRLNESGLFELWPLVEAEAGSDEEQPWQAPVDQEPARHPRRLLARNIAETIKSWIGKRVLPARSRVVQPDDILILLQSRGPLFSMLISELRKTGVPVAGADRLKLRESLIVQDMIILLQWLLIPQDDYALACALKGPLLHHALSEDDLMNLAIGRGTQSLWQRLQQSPDQNVAVLEDLQHQIQFKTPYDFFASLLNRTRNIIAERLGTEAIDASNAFLDQALNYQFEHGNSLAGFLHWFEATDTNIKREMEQAAGEVRIMTVHGAKGLEANIVFLADAASVPNGGRGDPQLLAGPEEDSASRVPLWVLGNLSEAPILKEWKVQNKLKVQAERNRLLYVAMTRACDELYVCGIKGANKVPPESWYAIIEAAVGPAQPRNFAHSMNLPKQSDLTEPLLSRTELPAWANSNAAKEIGKSIYSLTGLVQKHQSMGGARTSKALKTGTAVHALLHELSIMEQSRQVAYLKNWAKRLGFAETDALRLLETIKSPELAQFFGANSFSEAELRGNLPDGRQVSGRVDRLSIEDDQIFLLDYKTDRIVPESIAKSHPYTHQMALYSALLELAYPGRKINAALLWTQTAKLMWLEPEFLVLPRVDAIEQLELEAP